MRLVLDTNVVVSGLIWSGPPRQLLDLARKGRVVLFSSGVLLDELGSVLERDKFAAFLASRDVTPAFLMRRYGMLATLVKPTRITRTVPADPDDDHVIAAASAARADVIATGDGDLLRLDPWQGIRILLPAEVLRLANTTETERQSP